MGGGGEKKGEDGGQTDFIHLFCTADLTPLYRREMNENKGDKEYITSP